MVNLSIQVELGLMESWLSRNHPGDKCQTLAYEYQIKKTHYPRVVRCVPQVQASFQQQRS